MKPFWKLSGKFAGWISSSGRLYDHAGNNIGYLMENVVYSLDGTYLGEIYQRDVLGKRITPLHPSKSGLPSLGGLEVAPLRDHMRHRLPFGWHDPEF